MRIARIHEAWQKETKHRNLLLLFDITNVVANKELIQILKEGALESKKNGYFKKVAVIGATGLLKYFVTVVNRFSDIGATLFDSQEEALDWLVE